MFGLKIFNKSKSKKFKNDKDRKRYFAIQKYYRIKSEQQKGVNPVQKKKKTK